MKDKEKIKLQIRKLDKELSNYYKFYKYTLSDAYKVMYPKEFIKLQKLDQKRKELRFKIKNYETKYR